MAELFKRNEPWETPDDAPPAPDQIWLDASNWYVAKVTSVSATVVQYERHSQGSGGAMWSMPRAEWPGNYHLIHPAVNAFIDRTMTRADVVTAARVIQVMREEFADGRPVDEALRSVELAFGTIEGRD